MIMDVKFEKMIKLVFQSEELSPNDKLSKEINKVEEDELTEEELEWVCAARLDCYERFKRYMK